ncbi:lipopolysaccharide biosynthesis protein [Paenibacillus sp. GCM10023252]|uniref:lipopolysaccharide biosynthesis protein n=1 Tax=Paenibacillus sp. GCM10023252 TaxID=3252649 RepID=UPI0036087E8D
MSLYKSSMWSIIQTIATQIVTLVSNVLLARLLAPEVFGLLGMATLFTGLIIIIQEVGVSSYLIYKQGINEEFLSTITKMNLILSLLLASLLYYFSYPIAEFYNTPEIESIIKYISLGVVLGSFGITTRAILQKEMKFKKIAQIDVVAEVITTIASVALAIYGYSLLAITSKLLFRPAIQSVLFLRSGGFKHLISRAFRFDILRDMFNYSYKVLGGQILVYFSGICDYFLIGKFMGSRELGLYTMAFNWSFIVRNLISYAVSKAVFSEFSKLQDNLIVLSEKYLKLIKIMAFFLMPICIGLSYVASEFINILYGQEWKESIELLQVLMIAGLFSGISTMSNSLFKSIGRPDLEIKLYSIAIVFIIIFVYLGSIYGLLGVCYAMLIVNVGIFFVRSIMSCKLLNISILSYFKSFTPSLICTLSMFGIHLILKLSIFTLLNELVNLCISVIISIVSYIILSYYFNRECYNLVLPRIIAVRTKLSRRTERAY